MDALSGDIPSEIDSENWGLDAAGPTAVITRSHRQQRIIWAGSHRGLRWQDVVFSDESRFNLRNADRRIHLYRRRHVRYANNCVLQHNAYAGGGSGIMV